LKHFYDRILTIADFAKMMRSNLTQDSWKGKLQFMDTFILFMAHSGWRYIAFLVLVIAILKYLVGWLQSGKWSNLDRQIGLVAVIGVDIQVLLGIVLWALRVMEIPERMNAITAYIEHPVTMLIAIAIMHVGWARVRKTTGDTDKFRLATLTFIVTGLIVALGVARVTIWL
jgi:cytochrome b561